MGMTEEERKILEDRHYHQLNDGHEFRLNQSAFVGALIRYCWHLGKRKMSDLNHPKERIKNAYRVTVLSIILVIVVIGAYSYFS